MIHRHRFETLGARIGPCLLICLIAWAGWGCQDSQPENCLSTAEGYFRFNFTRAGSAEEILGVTQLNVTLQSMEVQSLNPPLTRYVLKSAGGATYWLDFQDLGYTLPLTVGATYSVRVEHAVDEFFDGYGLLVKDATGIRALVESDWKDAQSPAGNYVYASGYDDGLDLQVYFRDAGCDPRQENSDVYRILTTWSTTFVLDGQSRTLYQREQASLGPYTVRVVKAQSEIFNAGHESLIGPQFSWILIPTEDFGGTR